MCSQMGYFHLTGARNKPTRAFLEDRTGHSYDTTRLYSGASLSDLSVERRNHLAMEFWRSQKRLLSDGPYGFFPLCEDHGEVIITKRPFSAS